MATTLELLTQADQWLHFAYDPPKMTLTATQLAQIKQLLIDVDTAIGILKTEADMPAVMRMPMTTNPPQGMI